MLFMVNGAILRNFFLYMNELI